MAVNTRTVLLILFFSLSCISSMATKLKFCTYNCKGHGPDRIEYIKRLMCKCDILLLQEHWYIESDLCKLSESIGNVNVTGVSGVNERKLLMGRPYGGCALVYSKSLSCSIKPVDTQSCRLSACLIEISDDARFLVFNVYMPCDIRSDVDNIDTFKDVLQEIDIICTTYSDVNYIVFGGDLNTDLRRVRSPHTTVLTDFCDQRCLKVCTQHDVADIDYTYENTHTEVKSVLDHFIVSENLFSSVNRYYTEHEGDNTSDHSPVFMYLDIDCEHVATDDKTFVSKVSWKRATESSLHLYKCTLRSKLDRVDIPYEALHCSFNTCIMHNNDISRYHDQLLEACLSAANECLPVTKPTGKAGWSEYVKPYKDQAIFWHSIWVDNNKPNSGWVNDIRLRTKVEYKRISRWLIRNQEKLVADKLASSILDSDRDFWFEVKNVVKKPQGHSATIDDVQGGKDISQLFSAKYEDLYNSVPYDEGEMIALTTKLVNKMNNLCDKGECYSNHVVSTEDVKCAVSKLKASKADAAEGLMSDHFINACEELYVHISLLLTSMLKHSVAPLNMLKSTLVPIPKNAKKSMNDSNNYRSIALSSIICKVFDNIVLAKHAHALETCDLQFGFKKNHSTTQCTFLLQEVMDYYSCRDTPCYVVLLDASKAFDRIQYVKLFNLLLDRGLCPAIAGILLYMYTNQSLVVRWGSLTSEPFKCRNGIKQGGVLSPILFCVYMDELLSRLEKAKIGCHIGHHYMGAFCYADDVTLVAPSVGAAQKMLSICEKYAREYDVIFNSSKSVVLLHNVNSAPNLTLNGQELPCTEKAAHLGCFVGSEGSNANINKAVGDLAYRTNVLMSNFGYCDVNVLSKLFDTYCTSYYGSPLWKLDHSSLKRFCVAWRKCIRRIFKLDCRTRSKYLPLLMNKPDIETQLLMRFIKFWHACWYSENTKVSFCAKMTYEGISIVSENMRCVLRRMNCDSFVFNDTVAKGIGCCMSRLTCRIPEIDIIHANVIKELCLQRQGLLYSGMDKAETELMLRTICTDDF